jgi:benzil reductase ((S)-benzoin forming)
MQKIAVITGGGTGLGQAIAKQLAKQAIKTFIIGRRKEKLQETQAFFPKLIFPITADISLSQGRKKIKATLKDTLKQNKIDYIIHNAAIAFPIASIEETQKLTLSAFRKVMSANVEGPLFLTQLLLPQLNPDTRILHISSDCAHYPLANWIPYCTSKAALFMIYQCLKKEFADKNIHKKIYIGSIDPGMMDTPMQRAILDEKILFPEKLSLEELISQGLLFSPDYSASYCVKLLLESSPEIFSHQEHRVT